MVLSTTLFVIVDNNLNRLDSFILFRFCSVFSINRPVLMGFKSDNWERKRVLKFQIWRYLSREESQGIFKKNYKYFSNTFNRRRLKVNSRNPNSSKDLNQVFIEFRSDYSDSRFYISSVVFYFQIKIGFFIDKSRRVLLFQIKDFIKDWISVLENRLKWFLQSYSDFPIRLIIFSNNW